MTGIPNPVTTKAPLEDIEYPTSDGRPMGETDLHRSVMVAASQSCRSAAGFPAWTWDCSWRPMATGCGFMIRRANDGFRHCRKRVWTRSLRWSRGKPR